MDEFERKNEARKLATELNAEAVVRLIERQEEKLREFADKLVQNDSRMSKIEQELAAMKAAEFVRQAAEMGSGPTT